MSAFQMDTRCRISTKDTIHTQYYCDCPIDNKNFEIHTITQQNEIRIK